MTKKFKYNERVLVRAVIGPSGMTGDGGIFVRVNTDDPEIWVHLSDVLPLPKKAHPSSRDTEGESARQPRAGSIIASAPNSPMWVSKEQKKAYEDLSIKRTKGNWEP